MAEVCVRRMRSWGEMRVSSRHGSRSGAIALGLVAMSMVSVPTSALAVSPSASVSVLAAADREIESPTSRVTSSAEPRSAVLASGTPLSAVPPVGAILALMPPLWLQLPNAPIAGLEIVDVATGGTPERYQDAVLTSGGEIIRFRVLLPSGDVPSSFAAYRATTVHVADESGGLVSGGIRELGEARIADRAVSIDVTIPTSPGVYVLGITSDATEDQSGYMVSLTSILVLPSDVDPDPGLGGIASGTVLPVGPEPPMPAPPAPAPAAPPAAEPVPVPAPAPVEQAAAAEQPAVAVPAVASVPPAADAPVWLLPTTFVLGGTLIAGAIAWRISASVRRAASIRRLSRRP
jgi:hypothetical protein